jgi:hypothetical protein
MALSMGICTSSTDANAIVAVRTTSVDNLGHVGVGIQNDDGTWTIGGVEGDPDKTILWGAVVPPIFGDNGGWVEEHKTLQEVAVIFHAFGYDGLKIIQVTDANPSLANFEIKSFPTRGYNLVTNNCLSAVIDVLNAYGAKKLPLQIAHVAPNDYYANVKGEEYLWDSSKSKYTDLGTGMPLADNPSTLDGLKEIPAPLAPVSQGSESSVVGKWTFHGVHECKRTDDSSYLDNNVDDFIINFYNDGTFTSEPQTLAPGKWFQDGDTIHLQCNPVVDVKSFGAIGQQSDGDTYEGIINGDSISMTGSGSIHVRDDPEVEGEISSFDLRCSFHLSGSRVATGEPT